MKELEIGIIGGTGGIGRWFVDFFEKEGYTVHVSGRRTGMDMDEMAQKCQVVIVSVPIGVTTQVIEQVGPKMKKESLLMDFTSLKEEPVKAMLECSSSEVMGCHPLFGPDVSSIEGQNIVFLVDLNEKNVTIESNAGIVPNTFVYADKQGIKEIGLEGNKAGFSFVLVPNGDNYQYILTDPLQANSLFTKMFFFGGHGLKCFNKFDDRVGTGNQRIITWKADYNCQQENNVYFQPKEEVNAAHILISTQDKSEEEALALVNEIKIKANKNNFVELAKEYSDDPGSKENGGNLGWFGKGLMIPEFEEAVFKLNKGKISEPIKTSFGYHLILLLDKRMN